MKLQTVLQKAVLGAMFLGLAMQGCQKEDDVFVDKKADIGPEPGGTRTEQTLDSIFLYAKQIYLWNDALPTYQKFNPRKYSTSGSEIDAMEKELFDISQLKINSATGSPFEFVSLRASYPKYSYLEEDENFSGSAGARKAMVSNGTETDFGFGLASVSADDIRVRYVYPDSPAGKAGLSRADRLISINDREVRADSQSDIDFINSSMEQSDIKMTVEKKNGTISSVNLYQDTYTVNPVFKKSILTPGSAKVGYFVYDTFTRKSNSEHPLEEVFAEFAAAGVTDLVIDLRYNGGGYVHTAEYLCNLIAPSSLNGSVMYTELYNEIMREGKADILKNQVLMDENNQPKTFGNRNATYADLDFTEKGNTFTFAKTGPLDNIKSVVFIVSGSTASASELVINTLKPYLKVALVGDYTYGKPVGFFGITIDRYKMYVPNFQTINSEGEGDYFDGFAPDIYANDDVTADFGDPSEESLEMALAFIANGGEVPNGRISSANARRSGASGLEVKYIGGDTKFKGMVEERLNLPN